MKAVPHNHRTAFIAISVIAAWLAAGVWVALAIAATHAAYGNIRIVKKRKGPLSAQVVISVEDAQGFYRGFQTMTDEVLRRDMAFYRGCSPRKRGQSLEEYGAEAACRFREHHKITIADFNTDHWQTLFALEWPEARPL